MKILSIYPWTHISSSALMIDGKLVCGSAEERFNKIKWSTDFPIKSAEWCLEYAKINWKDLEENRKITFIQALIQLQDQALTELLFITNQMIKRTEN